MYFYRKSKNNLKKSWKSQGPSEGPCMAHWRSRLVMDPMDHFLDFYSYRILNFTMSLSIYIFTHNHFLYLQKKTCLDHLLSNTTASRSIIIMKYFCSISLSALHHEKFHINQTNELFLTMSCSKGRDFPLRNKKQNTWS